MQQILHLSRLDIIGDTLTKAPQCVLIEIADAHGISYNIKDKINPRFRTNLIRSITTTPITEIMCHEFNTSQLQDIARFVNKNIIWKKGVLLQCYNYLLEFTQEEDMVSKLPYNFVYGLQTMEHPKSINACILYKICTYHKINIDYLITIDKMASAVRLLQESLQSIARKVISFVESQPTKIDLINMLLSIEEVNRMDSSMVSLDYNIVQQPIKSITYDLLSDVCVSLNDISILRRTFDPATAAGAISLAAINFFVDISKSSCPILEYNSLKRSGRDNYIPKDEWLKYWRVKNPNMFDLTINFNPLFSPKFYGENISLVATTEGFSSKDISEENAYELCQLAYVSKTFYQGYMPNTRSIETVVSLETIDDVPYGELLCYGQIDVNLDYITISELIDLFTENKNFSSPFTSCEVFSSVNINKLKLIAKSSYGSDSKRKVSEETMALRKKLLDIITFIEFSTQSMDKFTKRFISTYSNSNPTTKQAIVNTLTNMLHIGMYMRGWSGKDNYPIGETNNLQLDDEEIAIKVTESVAKYESSCRTLGRIGTMINKLPLVLYKDSEYQVSTSRAEGITIGDRISIIKQGESTNNILSCIRLSSNWICSSAHKYSLAIGLDPPFQIYRLNYIS